MMLINMLKLLLHLLSWASLLLLERKSNDDIVFVLYALPCPFSTIEHLLPLFLTQLKDEVIFILFFIIILFLCSVS